MEASTTPGKIYALFVGINRYHPDSRVSNLYGCIPDVERMDSFLQSQLDANDRYASVLLKNSQATREGIINTFRDHLGKATAEDTVLFMFAGHGSRQPSAVEFLAQYPDQKDETLVCYDSRLSGGLDLADKELAVLISELQAKHVLVILDCCHSGSGTRDDKQSPEIKFRVTCPRKDGRSLDSYLDGFYKIQWEKHQVLSAPLRPHILLAACTHYEKAVETSSGYGHFSNSLMAVLKADGLGLSYADLFLRCRIAVKKYDHDQTPQFECYAGENPQATFLHVNGEASASASLNAYVEAGRWYIQLGALHQLPNGSGQSNMVSILDANGSSVLVQLKGIGPERSELNIPGGLQMPANGMSPATMRCFASPPVMLLVTASAAVAQCLDQNWPTTLNLRPTDDPALAEFHLHERDGRMELHDLRAGRLIQYTATSAENKIIALLTTLKKVLTWQRFRELTNRSMEAKFALANVQFELIDIQQKEIELPEGGGTVHYPATSQGVPAYFPICRVRNQTRSKLYFNLFYLSRKHSIELLASREIDPNDDWVTLWGDFGGHGLYLPDGIQSSTEYFKVIISAEEIQSWMIVQEGFEVGGEARGTTREMRDQRLCAISDWMTCGWEVELVREKSSS